MHERVSHSRCMRVGNPVPNMTFLNAWPLMHHDWNSLSQLLGICFLSIGAYILTSNTTPSSPFVTKTQFSHKIDSMGFCSSLIKHAKDKSHQYTLIEIYTEGGGCLVWTQFLGLWARSLIASSWGTACWLTITVTPEFALTCTCVSWRTFVEG